MSEKDLSPGDLAAIHHHEVAKESMPTVGGGADIAISISGNPRTPKASESSALTPDSGQNPRTPSPLPIRGEVSEITLHSFKLVLDEFIDRLFLGTGEETLDDFVKRISPYLRPTNPGIPADALNAAHETSELADYARKLENALRTINSIELEGNCCGCSSDIGFDKIKEIARQTLGDKPQQEKRDDVL